MVLTIAVRCSEPAVTPCARTPYPGLTWSKPDGECVAAQQAEIRRRTALTRAVSVNAESWCPAANRSHSVLRRAARVRARQRQPCTNRQVPARTGTGCQSSSNDEKVIVVVSGSSATLRSPSACQKLGQLAGPNTTACCVRRVLRRRGPAGFSATSSAPSVGSGQIYPQCQVLIEYPAQCGVHRMCGCEVAAKPTVHHDYRAFTQFGRCRLGRRTDRTMRTAWTGIQRPPRLVPPGGIHKSVLGDHEEFRGDPGVRDLGFGPCRCGTPGLRQSIWDVVTQRE